MRVYLSLLLFFGGWGWSTAPTLANQLSISQLVQEHLPGYHLAREHEYSKEITNELRGHSFYQADFNGDAQSDWAVLVVHSKKKTYGIYFLLSSPKEYQVLKLLEINYSLTTAFIQNPLLFKPKGDEGLSARKYNTLTNDGTLFLKTKEALENHWRKRAKLVAPYKAVPAIEVWTVADGKKNLPLDEMAYCSKTWYFQADQLKSFEACD